MKRILLVLLLTGCATAPPDPMDPDQAVAYAFWVLGLPAGPPLGSP